MCRRAMLRGNWRGETLGSGTDVWKYWAERRAGNLDEDSWNEIEDGIARSPGTCMTMGTAATMMSLAEALGMSFPEPPRSRQSMRPISACAPSAEADCRNGLGAVSSFGNFNHASL